MRTVQRLDLFWRTEFPRVVPVPFLLRDQLPGRWARFHHLPDSKRYPETEAEYRIVLERHDRLMAELFTPDPLTVVAGSMGGDGESGTFDDKLASVAGPFERWRSGFSDSVGYEWDLYAGPCDLGLHQILRWVANSDSAHIIMLQPPAPVLYHPYDGGVDVIAANVQSRDRLIAEFPDWLPPVGSPDRPTTSVS